MSSQLVLSAVKRSTETKTKNEVDRLDQNFRTIINRLQREVGPGGVEMILEDDYNDDSSTVHPLTHPLVFHYAVWSRDRIKVEYALKFLAEHCKILKCKGSYEQNEDIVGSDLYSIAGICTFHIVVKAMKMKIQFPSIQSLGCKVIEESLYIASIDKRNAAVESGALLAVLEAMKYFPKRLNVQRNGIGALLVLVWDTKHIAQKLIELNGLHLIVKALEAFQNDIVLLRNSCWILCNVSEMSYTDSSSSREFSFQQALVEANTLSVLGSAFQDFKVHGSMLIRSLAGQAMSKILYYLKTKHKTEELASP
jgi:hypothetical protein